MMRILELPPEIVNERVFYLGDASEDIYRWVNAFHMALRGVPARRVARPILRAIGLGGDVVSALTGRPFPLTSSRYRSMTSAYPVDMNKTFQVLGEPPVSVEQGVQETVHWLRENRGWQI